MSKIRKPWVFCVIELSEQQNNRCCYCGCRMWIIDGILRKNDYFQIDKLPHNTSKDMATIDHIIPKSKGGKDDISNIVIACSLCNVTRSDAFVFDFAKTNPMNFFIPNPKKMILLLLKKHLGYSVNVVWNIMQLKNAYLIHFAVL